MAAPRDGLRRLRPRVWSSLLGLLAVGILGVVGPTGCQERSVGASGDAALHPDGAPDAAVVAPDGAAGCGEPRLSMGLVWETHVGPAEPEPGVFDYDVSGVLIYLGPVTVPLASNPAFDREARIEHADGQVSVVQYHLPAGLSLPVEEGAPYTFRLRDRQGFEGSARGLVITRPTSGLPPLLFVGDTGTYGRAFAPEDLIMSPLKVYVEPRAECPAVPDPECGGNLLQDQLRFDSSTGGATIDVIVRQGVTADLELFGDPWRVTNLASTHVDQPCLDAPGQQVSYLAWNTTALGPPPPPPPIYYGNQDDDAIHRIEADGTGDVLISPAVDVGRHLRAILDLTDTRWTQLGRATRAWRIR